MDLIKQVKNFKLLHDIETNTFFIAKVLTDKKEILIAKIALPLGAPVPSTLLIEDHLQTYVVTFEDYQHFIQLIDEVYFSLTPLNYYN